MAKPPNKNKYAFAKSALRRASTYWYAMKEAEATARVSRGLYKCAMCLELFKRKEIQRDHIQPVVSTNGEKNDFNTYIETLFCEPENIQILCKPCHLSKSQIEGELRKASRAKKKKEKKVDD